MKVILIVVLMFPCFVLAGPIGEAQIVVELKAIYASGMQELKEAKAASDLLTETKDLAKYAYETYDEIRNFDLEKIKQIIESDIENLTELDDMKGMTAEQKYFSLTRELDRRIEDPNTPEYERKLALADKERIESILKQEDLINELHKNTTANLEKSASDLSERDSGRIVAENLSILARIEAAREKKRLENERAKVLDNASGRTMLQQQQSLSDGTGW